LLKENLPFGGYSPGPAGAVGINRGTTIIPHKADEPQDLGDDTLLCAPFMGVGRTLRNYKLAKKKSLAHIPVNGKCSSCSLVPSGQCQEGCKKSSTPDGSRNACANNNKGKSPSTCTVPFGNVITKKMWDQDGFPYWEFMRIVQRFEKS